MKLHRHSTLAYDDIPMIIVRDGDCSCKGLNLLEGFDPVSLGFSWFNNLCSIALDDVFFDLSSRTT